MPYMDPYMDPMGQAGCFSTGHCRAFLLAMPVEDVGVGCGAKTQWEPNTEKRRNGVESRGVFFVTLQGTNISP